MQLLALRFSPGQDPLEEIERHICAHQIEAACTVACLGSLTRAVLRFANQPDAVVLDGHFEILSLNGLFSIHGSHAHIAIADETGRTYGAHLLPGSRVYTTVELTLAVLPEVRFLRTFDPQSGYPELDVQPISF